jgi:hypothetical protein
MCMTEETGTTHVCHSAWSFCLYVVFSMSMNTGFQQTHNTSEFSETQNKCRVFDVHNCTDADRPASHGFHLDQNVLRAQKKDDGVLRSRNDQGALSYSLLC